MLMYHHKTYWRIKRLKRTSVDRILKRYEKDAEGYLYYIDDKERRRLIVPVENQAKIMEGYHDAPFGGNQGVYRKISVIKERQWSNSWAEA